MPSGFCLRKFSNHPSPRFLQFHFSFSFCSLSSERFARSPFARYSPWPDGPILFFIRPLFRQMIYAICWATKRKLLRSAALWSKCRKSKFPNAAITKRSIPWRKSVLRKFIRMTNGSRRCRCFHAGNLVGGLFCRAIG
jgi:hypothetical protein